MTICLSGFCRTSRTLPNLLMFYDRKTNFTKSDYCTFSIFPGGPESQVFYDIDFLCRIGNASWMSSPSLGRLKDIKRPFYRASIRRQGVTAAHGPSGPV